MSTIHFHYCHLAYACLYDLPCSEVLKSDDADRSNQQLLTVWRKEKKISVFVCAAVSQGVSEDVNTLTSAWLFTSLRAVSHFPSAVVPVPRQTV